MLFKKTTLLAGSESYKLLLWPKLFSQTVCLFLKFQNKKFLCVLIWQSPITRKAHNEKQICLNDFYSLTLCMSNRPAKPSI